MWVFRDPVRKLVFFHYHPGRDKNFPKEQLKNFKGYLQTDAYGAYESLSSIQTSCPALLACPQGLYDKVRVIRPMLPNSILGAKRRDQISIRAQGLSPDCSSWTNDVWMEQNLIKLTLQPHRGAIGIIWLEKDTSGAISMMEDSKLIIT